MNKRILSLKNILPMLILASASLSFTTSCTPAHKQETKTAVQEKKSSVKQAIKANKKKPNETADKTKTNKSIDIVTEKHDFTLAEYRKMGWHIKDNEMYKVNGLNTILNAEKRSDIEKTILLGQLARETLWGMYMTEVSPRKQYVGFQGAGWIQLTGFKNYQLFSDFYRTWAPKSIVEQGVKTLATPGKAPYLVANKYPSMTVRFYWDWLKVNGNGTIHENINRMIKNGASYEEMCKFASNAINPGEKSKIKAIRHANAKKHLNFFNQYNKSRKTRALLNSTAYIHNICKDNNVIDFGLS